MDSITIGEKIKKARIEAGLNQSELAEKVGVKQSHIARYEANGRTPTLNFLILIAKATQKKPGWFLNDL